MNRDTVIRSAYREAVLALMEKGYKGPAARPHAIKAAAKIATKVLKQPVSDQDVADVIGNG